MPTVSIVPYDEIFLTDLYRISLATGHMGGDASHLYRDPKMMGHIYSAPYAVLEPSLVLVAMDEEGVAGFVLGVAETAAWEDRLEGQWWPRLRADYPDPDDRPSAEWTPDERRAHAIHHPSRVPAEISAAYPAHLHMNLLPRIQGGGIGQRLLEAWLDLAAPAGIDAVHVGVNRQNEKAARFWNRAGFAEIELKASEPGRTLWMGRTLPKSRQGRSR